jgi:nucleoside-diphosphate-sugar epimerase
LALVAVDDPNFDGDQWYNASDRLENVEGHIRDCSALPGQCEDSTRKIVALDIVQNNRSKGQLLRYYSISDCETRVMSFCDALRGKFALVTGANGFIAGRLTAALSTAGCAVRCHTRSDGDLGEKDAWNGILVGADVVFHLAAQTSARFSEEHPETDRRINVDSVMHLVQVARDLRRSPTVVFTSTDTIAGCLDGVVDDGTPDEPRTIYELHKLQAEQILQWGTRREFVRGVALRLSTVYGPGGKVSKPDRGVINSMIIRALNGESLTVYGDGAYQRDLLHVDDVVEALCAAAQRIDSVQGEHYVVADGRSIAIGRAFALIAQAAAAVTSRNVAVEYVPWPRDSLEIDRRSVRLDPSGFQQCSGWTAKHRFENAVEETARFFASRSS